LLVAHSLACPLVAHLAARQPDLPVTAALLVAPADVDSARHTPSHTRGFAPIPRSPLPFRSIVVASTNDPFIALERARDLAAAWGSEFVDVGPCGHINVASGFGLWPAGESIVAAMMPWAETSRRLSRNKPRATAIS
jgi:predicted alpha/beta hydrolase family esterase